MVHSVPQAPNETDLIKAAEEEAEENDALQLRVVDGPDYGLTLALNEIVVVGSAPEADLVLNDPTVSRRHAELTPGPLGVEIRDLESKNGIYQSGVRIVHGHLTLGAEIVIGRTLLRIDGPDVVSGPTRMESRSALHGNSSATRRLRAEIARAGRVRLPALIEGERGTGRVRVARAIHEASIHKGDSFVVLPASSIDHAGVGSRIGQLRGTVLLAEIDQLSDEGRKALVAELEEDRIAARLLVSTTSAERAFSRDRVSEELGRRLSRVLVRVPPLRERASDLPSLVTVMLAELGHPHLRLGPEDLGQMQAHSWPENLRELKTFLIRLIERERTADRSPPPRKGTETIVGADLPYKEARARMIQAFEREYAQALLERTAGNVSRAARIAGIDRVYLHRLIKKYGISGNEKN